MIRVSQFNDMSVCTDAEVERMVPLVPEPRRSQALSFKFTFGRFACLKSYLMLAALLQAEFGLEDFRIEIGEHGKPYLVDHPDIHFNISHCQKAIAVAVSDQPVGVDVEMFRKVNDSLIDKCMNEREKADIISSVSPEETFIAYWTRKEAAFKLFGTGITDNLHGILSEKVATDTTINRELGYAISVAAYNKEALAQSCWL